MLKKILSVLLIVLLCCSVYGCGGAKEQQTPKEIKIGVLLPDGGNVGVTREILQGVGKAAEAQNLPQVMSILNVTDVSFDKSASISATAAQTQTEAPTDAEPESYTLEDGEVIVRAVPLPQETPVKAVEAAAEMLEEKCSVIVAGDPMYDELTAFLAEKYPDVTFLQYRGKHTDMANLQSFSDDADDAFFLAGVVAGCEGVKQIGFTARKGDPAEQANINAFARGVEAYNKDAKIAVRFTGTQMDLSLERTIPQTLIKTDKCGLLAQSVYTALPLTVAAEQDKPLPCIGFGYDMKADGGSAYLCSVIFDFSVYFKQAVKALTEGTFDASPYSGGLSDGMVTLSALQNAKDKTTKAVDTETQALKDGTRKVFDGFKAEKNGYAPNVKLA